MDQSKKALELFSLIQDELDEREEDLKDGLSFLDLKNDTLLSYMIDVCNIVLRKVRGESISGHASVERCVEYRVILEKIKTIDQKLAYQLNKLITLPENATEEDQRIDINNLDVDLSNEESNGVTSAADDDSDDDEDDENSGSESLDVSEGSESQDEDATSKLPALSKTNKKGVYKPPKLRSVAYVDDQDVARGDRGRRKNYDDFYRDEDTGDIVEQSQRADKYKERTRFEEENYTRLPEDNPQKAKRKLKTKEYRRKGRGKAKRRKR